MTINLAPLLAGTDCEETVAYTYSIPPGDEGIAVTVEAMRALIRAGSQHPVVRRHAELAVAGVDGADQHAELLAVVRYLKQHVDYRHDPTDAEQLQVPWWVLQCQIERGRRPQLDCDDLSVLSLSMLGAIGFPSMIRVVSTLPTEEFNHVYGGVMMPDGEWARVDLTYAWMPAAQRYAPETRFWEVEV